VLLALFIGMYLALSFLLISATRLPYAMLTSPAGENVAVLRLVSTDAALIAQRMEARGEDASNGPQSEADLGYTYAAYPCVTNYFYNKNAAGEGSVEIGMASAAELSYAWTDDGDLHISILNPEPGDAGEYILSLN